MEKNKKSRKRYIIKGVGRFLSFYHPGGWPEIRSKLEGLMLEIHRRPRNHCTIRDGKSVRGFSGVTFK